MLHLIALALAGVQPPATAQVGVGLAASSTIIGQPATFDLAGFRLGMREADVQQILRARGMMVRRRTRTKTFEDNVRSLVNVRGGNLQMKGGDVLDEIELDDGNGGRVMLRMLSWPDGAHVRSVAYLPPAGTTPQAWRDLLSKRFGPPSRDSDVIDSAGLHASWCGRAACSGDDGVFRLGVNVDASGGEILLVQPVATAERLKKMIEDDATTRSKVGTPAF